MPMFIIEKSSSPNHRYQIEVYGKKIYFGSPNMDNYLIHRDNQRRDNYLKRSSKIKNKEGKFTRSSPLSPNYFSRRVLWLSGEPWLGIDKKYHSLLNSQIQKVIQWEKQIRK